MYRSTSLLDNLPTFLLKIGKLENYQHFYKCFQFCLINKQIKVSITRPDAFLLVLAIKNLIVKFLILKSLFNENVFSQKNK